MQDKAAANTNQRQEVGTRLGNVYVKTEGNEQPETHRMRYERHRGENRAHEPVQRSTSPCDRDREKGESHREVKIHETGVERETVRDDRNRRNKGPGNAPGRCRDERECAPEKCQNTG